MTTITNNIVKPRIRARISGLIIRLKIHPITTQVWERIGNSWRLSRILSTEILENFEIIVPVMRASQSESNSSKGLFFTTTTYFLTQPFSYLSNCQSLIDKILHIHFQQLEVLLLASNGDDGLRHELNCEWFQFLRELLR